MHFREMCLRFADLERKLGEIDRARAVYTHCSEMCDPRVGIFYGNVAKRKKENKISLVQLV